LTIAAALIGLPQSGKTTLFSAISRVPYQRVIEAEAGSGMARSAVPVPDERAEALARLVGSERIVRVIVEFTDFAAAARSKGSMLSGAALNVVSQSDVLVAVLRDFEYPAGVHTTGKLDPIEDFRIILAELEFIDLDIADRRLKRIEEQLKKVKVAEREALRREQALLVKVREALEASLPIRELELAPDEERQLRGYQFLSAKPIVAVFNASEDRLSHSEQLVASVPVPAAAVASKLEADTAGMPEEEANELLASLGVATRARFVLPQICLRAMGLVCFYTFNEEEVRVWAVSRDTPVVEAAGQIHSDLQRGFIRAEVVRFDDMIRLGSLAEARKHGALRVEGRNYRVQDGDIIHVLFST
jgi:GTP-binding protein YchF